MTLGFVGLTRQTDFERTGGTREGKNMSGNSYHNSGGIAGMLVPLIT